MKVPGHVAVSLAAGTILYNRTHSLPGFLWFLAAGILIDGDHYIDYARERGISFNPKKVYDGCKNGFKDFKKIVLFLHSYELAMLLWLAILMFKLDVAWVCGAIGFSLHLFVDQITNPTRPLSYFILFRIANNFEANKVALTKEVRHAHRHR